MRPVSLDAMVEGLATATNPAPDDGWTLGWDVVVSYSQKEINKTLYQSWEKHSDDMLTTVETTVDMPPDAEDDDWGDEGEAKQPIEKRTRTITLQLGAPRIRFVEDAVTPAVDLILPVKGGTSRRSDRPNARVTYPENGYEVVLSGIKIGTVTGKYDTIKGKKQLDAYDLDVDGGCVFSNQSKDRADDDFEVSWVVLDFDLRGRRLQVTVDKVFGESPSSKRTGFVNSRYDLVREAAEAFFLGSSGNGFMANFNIIRHALATVKNKPLPKNTGVTLDLTPKSFRMATCSSASILQEPVLSLFIHVADGKDAGEVADLQDRWRAQWVDVTPKIPPIPETYTASILIHPDLLWKKAIADSILTNASEDEWKLERLNSCEGGGIAFHASWQKPFQKDTFYLPLPKETDFEEFFAGTPYLEVGGWKKDLKQNPATVQIYQKDMKTAPVAHIQWTFSIESQWQKVYLRRGDPNSVKSRHEAANNRTTFSINHDFPLEIKATDSDIVLNIDVKEMESRCTLKDEWKTLDMNWIDLANQKLGELENKIWHSAGVKQDALDQRHKKMKEVRPQFKFGTIGVAFFLATNLLNPGAKVIDIDREVGIRMPGNMLLVGHVVQGSDSVKSTK